MTNLLGSPPKPLPPKPTGASKMSQLKSLLGKSYADPRGRTRGPTPPEKSPQYRVS